LVYSLILPSSVFGVVHEERGAGLMVREKANGSIVSIAPGHGGMAKEENFSSNARTTNRLTWTTHKTYGMGASGRLY